MVFSVSAEEPDDYHGVAEWKTLRDDVRGRPVSLVHDVVHVAGGRFLAVTRCHGKILDIDLAAGDHGNDEVPSVSLFSGPLASAESAVSFGSASLNVENRLVVLVDGEVYQVWASWAGDRVPEEEEEDADHPVVNRYRIEEVGVVRCDPAQSTGWSESEVEDLLVGRNETTAVRAGVERRLRLLHRRQVGRCAVRVRTEERPAGGGGGGVLREVPCAMAPPVWFMPSLDD